MGWLSLCQKFTKKDHTIGHCMHRKYIVVKCPNFDPVTIENAARVVWKMIVKTFSVLLQPQMAFSRGLSVLCIQSVLRLFALQFHLLHYNFNNWIGRKVTWGSVNTWRILAANLQPHCLKSVKIGVAFLSRRRPVTKQEPKKKRALWLSTWD